LVSSEKRIIGSFDRVRTGNIIGYVKSKGRVVRCQVRGSTRKGGVHICNWKSKKEDPWHWVMKNNLKKGVMEPLGTKDRIAWEHGLEVK